MSKAIYLTTFDNPYDPEKEWRQWYYFDMTKGYGSCEYLARIGHISNQLSDEENLEEIERAIDEIVRINGNLYKKIVKDVDDSSYYKSGLSA